MGYPYNTDIVIRSQEDVEKYIDVKLARHIFIAKGVEANLPNLQHASQDVQIEGHIVAEKLRSIHGELIFKNSAQADTIPVLTATEQKPYLMASSQTFFKSASVVGGFKIVWSNILLNSVAVIVILLLFYTA